MGEGRRGLDAMEGPSSFGPNRQAPSFAGLKTRRRDHQTTVRGAGWRLLALFRHFDFDIDIGTQPSTATPPSSRASPRIRLGEPENPAVEAGRGFRCVVT